MHFAAKILDLDRNVSWCRERFPNKPITLGLYLYDYGDGRRMPMDLLQQQCSTALGLLEDGDIQGLVFLTIDNDAETIIPADADLFEAHLPEINEEDDALLLYTSGTTGDPKGVILSHKNMVAGGQYTIAAHGLTAEDRALCSLPLYHINGEVVTVVAPLISAGSVVMPHKFSTANFWQLISEYRCTWLSVVPTIISYLMSATDLKGKKLNQNPPGANHRSNKRNKFQKHIIKGFLNKSFTAVIYYFRDLPIQAVSTRQQHFNFRLNLL